MSRTRLSPTKSGRERRGKRCSTNVEHLSAFVRQLKSEESKEVNTKNTMGVRQSFMFHYPVLGCFRSLRCCKLLQSVSAPPTVAKCCNLFQPRFLFGTTAPHPFSLRAGVRGWLK
jgi:hypothetical protein